LKIAFFTLKFYLNFSLRIHYESTGENKINENESKMVLFEVKNVRHYHVAKARKTRRNFLEQSSNAVI
jgi:hypothetical protein